MVRARRAIPKLREPVVLKDEQKRANRAQIKDNGRVEK